jgi:TetR/AcrR family transcriptional regulator, transcriptional repressor for nem operon
VYSLQVASFDKPGKVSLDLRCDVDVVNHDAEFNIANVGSLRWVRRGDCFSPHDTSTSILCDFASNKFKDKMTLVRAVIAYETDAVLGAQDEFLGHLDSMRALRQWRDLLVRIQRGLRCEGGCPLGSLSSEITEIAPEYRIDLKRAFRRWEGGIRRGLRALHERGELRADADPDRLATALLAAVQGGLLLTQIRRNTKPLQAAIDTMLDHIESLLSRN